MIQIIYCDLNMIQMLLPKNRYLFWPGSLTLGRRPGQAGLGPARACFEPGREKTRGPASSRAVKKPAGQPETNTTNIGACTFK